MINLSKQELSLVLGGSNSQTSLATNSPSIGFAGLGGGDVVLCKYGPTGLTAKKVTFFSDGASAALSKVSAASEGPTLPPGTPKDENGCPIYSELP